MTQRRGGLTLNAHATRHWPAGRIRRELATFFTSTRVSWCWADGQISLQGPDGAHLKADPDLRAEHLAAQTCAEVLPNAHGWVDLCLEDNLSGLFLSRQISAQPLDDWVVLHLDDHRDMMVSYLAKSADGSLRDPETGALFRASSDQAWHDAIARGTVTIGNYITPLFHEMPPGTKLHIRHLRPTLPIGENTEVKGVFATSFAPDFLSGPEFAALDLSDRATGEDGTYQQSTDAAEVLSELPPGRLLVHCDLDFFVNDFNGNPGTPAKTLDDAARAAIRARIRSFFAAIARLNRPVERWVIATSPGFCAVRNWRWLLGEIDAGIADMSFDPREVSHG